MLESGPLSSFRQIALKTPLPPVLSRLEEGEGGSGTERLRMFISFVSIHIYCNFLTGSVVTSRASQLSPTELIEMQNDLFNKEKNRQLSLTPRTEKIEVKHVGKTDPGTIFVLNKNVSTPYSCAMRK